VVLPGGLCIDQSNSYRCVCPYGVSGHRCDVIVDYCAASPGDLFAGLNAGPCLNGATCVSVARPSPGGAHFACHCPPGFRGKLCQIRHHRHGNVRGEGGVAAVTVTGVELDESGGCTIVCLHGGTCVQRRTSGATYVSKCECIVGYGGSDCGSRQRSVSNNSSSPKDEHLLNALPPRTVRASTSDDFTSIVDKTTTTADVNERLPVGDGQQTIVIITAVVASFAVSTVVIATALVTCFVRRRRASGGGEAITDGAPVDVIAAPITRHCDVTRANNIAVTSSTKDAGKWSPSGGLERTQELPSNVRVKNVLFV